ncbi:MAG: YebC/PmpR family DNA-binding transcriptional regulator [bacterium]|nr:YebC/PmpR family DNA-binding transcriptional regulator [bacterium]
MSGHNKWSKIKHKKAATDAKKSNLFSKHLGAISAAAKGNPSPDANPTLRSAIERAKADNVPASNIENALNRARETKDLSEMIVEAYGPEGIGIIIEAETDNTNRTIAELKKLIADSGAKYAESGSVLWGFEKDENQNWKAKFPQTVSKEAKNKLEEIKLKLSEHSDVVSVSNNCRKDEL